MAIAHNRYNPGMDKRVGDDLILERMYAREQVLLTQADALDMKASALLVVLVFLTQLSTMFLSRPALARLGMGSQRLSCLLLLVSGIFVMMELMIQRFRGEDALGLEDWHDEVARQADTFKESMAPPISADHLRTRLIWGLISSSKERILRSEGIIDKKVSRRTLAYWLASAAFLLDALFLLTAGLSLGL